MKIILSPTKKMKEDLDTLRVQALPCFLPKTRQILNALRSSTAQELKDLWGCNEKIAEQNLRRLEIMDLQTDLTPAILAYEGIAFQYMAPAVFTDQEFQYVQEHLRILSGFYGCLKPLDGVRSYRLEMQAKLALQGFQNLYDFWGDDLYRQVLDESGVIVNLASKEYYKCILPYLKPEDRFVTCTFCEMVRGKLQQKGTFAKMARGEMVRFLSENQAETPEAMKDFQGLHYHFRSDLSSDTEYVFERRPENPETP